LNMGDFKFKDVTDQARVGGTRAWSTGVSMVDINGDGWLDIYVCNSGDIKGDNKQNEFFINNGDGTFSEQAEVMGLADRGFSTHAAFFDYDKDEDLDVYLLNNSYRAIGSFDLNANERHIRDELGGDKLLRNDSGKFTDVSVEAGIHGSEIGFGLGISVSDLDKDSWPDLYISNDFFERDYIYMNNGDETFSESLEKQMRSISLASMGSDIADISGDGYPEVFVTEMLPEPDDRFKTTMNFENWDQYQNNLKNDYYHQFTRNMLHQHNGVTPGGVITFSEVGRLAGVEATDWSWSSLITDLDNDGYKDLFISNGLANDILHRDYTDYVVSEEVAKMVVKKEGVDYKHLIDLMPSNKISNYAYAGGPGLTFTNKTETWGLATPSHSNGAAYGDLDNDGDLDLVVNNVNMPLFVCRNQAVQSLPENNYLKVVLSGKGKNTLAIGSKVTVKAEGKLFYLEQSLSRGFQSSIDPRLHFGLGELRKIDTLLVEWYYGGVSLLTDLEANQTIELNENEFMEKSPVSLTLNGDPKTLFREMDSTYFLDYHHKENSFVDFDRDRLLYHLKSTEGPRMAKADVNGDGREDVFIGGAKDSPGELFIQSAEGAFHATNMPLFETDKSSEDLDCLFFDAEGDGDPDLYVTSGGNEFSNSAFPLVDRLYLNDGKGNFIRSEQILPNGKPESTSTVDASDYDGDGDQDLFVGVRLRHGNYGVPQTSYLLENDGNGGFKNVTSDKAKDLIDLGMVTDALWADYDQDKDLDLIVVGEWMPITFFENKNGQLHHSHIPTFQYTVGWWNRIASSDLNGDGFPDFVVGNHGLNSRFRASRDKPISCYINDFDHNGTAEQIISQFNGDSSYTMALRQDIVKQMPHLLKKYNTFEAYKEQRIEDVFSPEELTGSVIHQAYMLESVALLSDGQGGFEIKPLPREAQLAPVYAILLDDLDKDGRVDILIGGNLYGVKPEVGRYDASYGSLIKGLGDRRFEVIAPKHSGLMLGGEIRDFVFLNTTYGSVLTVARNNDRLQLFAYGPGSSE
ncbi:MAG: VCBS repeat-containing protein, partial [Cyclobacteriaceae bacterium]